MAKQVADNEMTAHGGEDYILEEQVGFLLRQVNQRHAVIFSEGINDALTPTQFAVLVKLRELQVCSQNELGRLTAMDAATVKGVVERLKARSLLRTVPDTNDRRRLSVELTKKGVKVADEAINRAFNITDATLAPLSASERRNLLRLLNKML